VPGIDWLLITLILVFGAYTCKCPDYSLTVGVQNALSIRAREIIEMFAATGKYPVVQGLLDWDRTIHSLQWIRESSRHLISTADQKLTW
jgi:hypothetical protein